MTGLSKAFNDDRNAEVRCGCQGDKKWLGIPVFSFQDIGYYVQGIPIAQ